MTPRQRLALVAAVLVAAGLGFSAGAFAGPERVETREVEKLVYRDLTVEQLTRGYAAVRTETRVVYRNIVTTITVTPDAGTTTTIADNSIERAGTEASTALVEERVVYRDRDVIQEREVEKVVTVRADWSVGAQVGATWKEPGIPVYGPLVLGVTAERRIVGGVFGGLWFNTVGAGGVTVRAEF